MLTWTRWKLQKDSKILKHTMPGQLKEAEKEDWAQLVSTALKCARKTLKIREKFISKENSVCRQPN